MSKYTEQSVNIEVMDALFDTHWEECADHEEAERVWKFMCYRKREELLGEGGVKCVAFGLAPRYEVFFDYECFDKYSWADVEAAYQRALAEGNHNVYME